MESKLAIAKKALRHLDASRGLIEGNFDLSPRVVLVSVKMTYMSVYPVESVRELLGRDVVSVGIGRKVI